MSDLKIVKTLVLKAPREHVWKFLTQADQLALWFFAGSKDLEEGGDYELVTNSVGKEGEVMMTGRVLEYVKPERLVHTFTHQHMKNVETTCTWTLAEVGGNTVLTLVHSGWEAVENSFDMAANHDKGWDEHFARFRHVAT